MKINQILKNTSTMAALCLTSLALISCDSGSDSSDNNNNGGNNPSPDDNSGDKSFTLKVGSSFCYDLGSDRYFVKFTQVSADGSAGKADLQLEEKDWYRDMDYSYVLDGGRDCFKLVATLDEDKAISELNVLYAGQTPLSDPPSSSELENLAAAVRGTLDLGFAISYTGAGTQDWKIFIVTEAEVKVEKGRDAGVATLRGPAAKLSGGKFVKLNEIETKLNQITDFRFDEE